jgi:hypothetical protein
MLKWVNVIMLKYSKSQKKKLLRKWSVTQGSRRSTELHRDFLFIKPSFSIFLFAL